MKKKIIIVILSIIFPAIGFAAGIYYAIKRVTKKWYLVEKTDR